jgi:hypothetical protein
VKRGYDPEEVDRYIEALEQVVKSYKDKDSAIKNAIVSAQLAADNIVKNAHIQVAESRTQALSQIQNIISSISEQRQKVKEFQDEYNDFVRKYLIDFNEADMTRIYNCITDLENIIARASYIAPTSPGASYGAQASQGGFNTGYTAPSPPYQASSVAYESDYEQQEA